MGRLTGSDLTTFFVRCKRFYKVDGAPRQIRFMHDTHADGDATYKIITQAYSEYYSNTYSGFTRETWTFRADSEESRDAMFDDLLACRAEYEALTGNNPDVSQANTSDNTDDEEEEKKSSDLTTYIIIGVAAAIIIALLIPWNGK